MVADPMTKGLTLDKFREYVAKMGLRKRLHGENNIIRKIQKCLDEC
jgi:hypothetical protein